MKLEREIVEENEEISVAKVKRLASERFESRSLRVEVIRRGSGAGQCFVNFAFGYAFVRDFLRFADFSGCFGV